MKLRVNYFNESLNIGNIGEVFTKGNFLRIFRKPLLDYLYSKRFDFDLNEEIQRAGIDGKTSLDLFKWEVKTRTQFYPDILLEIRHSYNKPGWFFTSKADIIAYLFLDKNKHVECGFLLIMSKLRDYFSQEKLSKYPEIKAYSDSWETYNVAVPFKDFPNNSLISIPNLKNFRIANNQKSLEDFSNTESITEV